MKGIVFTEFVEFAEKHYGVETADEMIVSCDLATDGAYTSVGDYDLAELVQLVTRLAELTGTEIPEVLRNFGRDLFGRLIALHPDIPGSATSAFEMLQGIDSHIHREVRKLYPDSDPPRFDCEQPDADTLLMTYRSERGLADVATGLIESCFQHFGESATISTQDLSDGAKTIVRFVLNQGDSGHGV